MTHRLVAFTCFVGSLGLNCATPAPHRQALEANGLCAVYLSRGELQTAEDQCDLGLQFSPQYADLWANKGLIAMSRGQTAKAKDFLIKALRLNQDHAEAYNNLGVLYLQELKYNTAADNFARALRVNPDYLQARFNLATAHMALKEFDAAKKELRTLTLIHPDLAQAWAQLGQLALDENDHATAIELLTKATALDPKFTTAWLALGNAQTEAGHPCEGKDAYTACLENEESNVQCRNNILIAEKRCALQDRALADVRDRQAGRKTPQGEYEAALAFKERGLLSDEERAYRRCIRYDEKFALCYYGLFMLYKARSDGPNATTACKKFLKYASESELAPQVTTCQRYLGN